ncbi:MAG: endonuclease/exonuclease/phosphatase family protein [Leptolyngbyaceae cyanobacterium]
MSLNHIPSWVSVGQFLLKAIAVLTAIISIGSRLGRWHWAFDWFTLICDRTFGLALLLAIAFALLRWWPWLALATVLLFLNGALLWGYLPFNSGGAPAVAAETADLRLYIHNIYYQNPTLAAVVAEGKAYDPDVIFLMEYSEAIQAQIESQFTDYPYRLIKPSRYTMGLALFSRLPLEVSQIHQFEGNWIPIFETVIALGKQSFTLIGGHPWPPAPRWAQLHREQVAAMAQVAAGVEGPLIIAGDFNATPWSFALRDLMSKAKVRDARLGFGLAKTRHHFPYPSLMLDHGLVSAEWQVVNYQQGNARGSDHQPLILDLKQRPITQGKA